MAREDTNALVQKALDPATSPDRQVELSTCSQAVREALAGNPSLAPEAQVNLWGGRVPILRRLAVHPNLTEASYDWFCNSERHAVRALVAKNPNLPWMWARGLVLDEHPSVVKSYIFSGRHLDLLWTVLEEGDEEKIAVLAYNRALGLEEYKLVAERGGLKARQTLASRDWVSHDLLHHLAENYLQDAYFDLARNDQSCQEILDLVANIGESGLWWHLNNNPAFSWSTDHLCQTLLEVAPDVLVKARGQVNTETFDSLVTNWNGTCTELLEACQLV